MPRRSYLFIPLLLAGVFMRFHALDRQSLWDDEFSTLRTISTPAQGLVHRFSNYETHPPLYFFQLKIWQSLHMRSLVKLRANSAFWGSLSLFLIYLTARLYGGEWAGLLGLAVFALSPLHLAFSQELRPYAMGMAIGLASLLALEYELWWYLGFLWTALLYTHYWGTFVVLAQAVYGLSRHPRRHVMLCAGVAALLFLPWLPILVAQLKIVDGLAFWVPGFSFGNLAKVLLAYTGLMFNNASWTFYLPTQVWVLALFGLAFTVALGNGLVRYRGPAIWLGVGLAVPWLLSAWKPTIFLWYRYPVLIYPAFVLLVALGVGVPSEVRRLPAGQAGPTSDVARWTIAAVLIASQAWGAWTYFHHWQKANPKSVVQYVHVIKSPNTVVVRPNYFADLFAFYDQNTSEVLDENLLDSAQKRSALRKRKSVILLAFDATSDPIADAFLQEYEVVSARYFPGTAHLGITVYQLK